MREQYSTELGHVPVTWDREHVMNAPWHQIPFHEKHLLKPAYDAGYTDRHLEFWCTGWGGDKEDGNGNSCLFNDVSDEYWARLKPTVDCFPNSEWATVRYQMMPPGAVYPPHIDPTPHINYRKYWKTRYGLDVPMKDDDDIRRAIVFAGPHRPGHFSLVEDKMFYGWNPGDFVYFGRRTHAAGNFGKINRYVLLVTYFV